LADGDAGKNEHPGNFTRDAALLTETVREAGRLALSLFRTELKNWIKGASSPVSEAERMAGCRRKAPTTKYASAKTWCGLSTRSMAPVPTSPAAKTGVSA
jgi:hypothetical protein